MKTQVLIKKFLEKYPDRGDSDLYIDDNEDETITLVLEGIAEKIYPKPDDFNEYIKNLQNQ